MDLAEIKKEIKELEEEISNTPKNKSTEQHLGRLKAKIAKLKEKAEKVKSKGSKGPGFAVKKTGDATVGLVGFPSVGKSTLLNRLTGAKSEVAYYQFTTLETIPGMLKYKGANIQILDLPGLIQGASEGKGRGHEILSATRAVDLIIFMLDAQNKGNLDLMYQELYNAGLRLNEKKPDVQINPKGQGGINVASTVKLTHLNENIVKSICSEYMVNATVSIREDITEEQLIDVLQGNRSYIPAFVLLNKIDTVPEETVEKKIKKINNKGWKVVPISAKTEKNIPQLKEKIFKELDLIRVYLKPVGEQADMEEPLILNKGATIQDACVKLHRDFKKRFRYATVTGPSAKHENQNAGLDHQLKDGDILTIVIKK